MGELLGLNQADGLDLLNDAVLERLDMWRVTDGGIGEGGEAPMAGERVFDVAVRLGDLKRRAEHTIVRPDGTHSAREFASARRLTANVQVPDRFNAHLRQREFGAWM